MTAAMLAAAVTSAGCVGAAVPAVEAQAQLRDKDDLSFDVNPKLSDQRQDLVYTALSLEGKVHYTWGGKAAARGWNEQWSSGSGLDCSGFVEWVYWTALGIHNGLGSTAQISSTGREISESDLKPGDLGLLFDGGSGFKAQSGKSYDTEEEAKSANQSDAASYINAYINGKSQKSVSGKGSQHAQAIAYANKVRSLKEKLSSVNKKLQTPSQSTQIQELKKQAETNQKEADKTAASLKQVESSITEIEQQLEEARSSGNETLVANLKDKLITQRKTAKSLRSQEATYRQKAKEYRNKAERLREQSSSIDRAALRKQKSSLQSQISSYKKKAVRAEAASYHVKKSANHVGIYAGKNAQGQQIWIHCNSSHDTVSVEPFSGFHYFVRISFDETYTIRNKKLTQKEAAKTVYDWMNNFNYSLRQQELYLGPNEKDVVREVQAAERRIISKQAAVQNADHIEGS